MSSTLPNPPQQELNSVNYNSFPGSSGETSRTFTTTNYTGEANSNDSHSDSQGLGTADSHIEQSPTIANIEAAKLKHPDEDNEFLDAGSQANTSKKSKKKKRKKHQGITCSLITTQRPQSSTSQQQ